MEKVLVREEMRTLMAYREGKLEDMPMFAENRVHQRTSGNPYPNKVALTVNRGKPEPGSFRVITLENEYLVIELMPDLGGRIYSARDKRTGYDFFYKQHVIKPALIGMLGNWISGGVEFNWPCHHRPSTFMPVDVETEFHENGAVTVWMSEHEPLDRMKGMVGIHLEPGEARFDTRMKVYNRTPERHSFLWWENAAVPVNPDYRLVFPPDVRYVQFHYRKDVATYPVASGVYNGIRMGEGVDISRHGNTRAPTSYFCGETRYEFFGGYDEAKQCGVIHVADRTVSVGKKMFTWGYNQLSESWEHALTDTDGAYAELMASSYSLNQPDFAWLSAYEEREFSQMWYPVGPIGTPLVACGDAALSFHDGRLYLTATRSIPEGRIVINGTETCFAATPEEILSWPVDGSLRQMELQVGGQRVLSYAEPEKTEPVLPKTLPDNPPVNQGKTAEECYLLGVHVEQYRDPVARPEAYYEKALSFDPEYAPALTAMARRKHRQFLEEEALAYIQRAWRKLTMRNYHPESGEAQYVLGQILEARGQLQEAMDAYCQAAWALDARSRALTRAAMIACRTGEYSHACRLAEQALDAHPRNETAMLVLAAAERRLGHGEKAGQVLSGLGKMDPLCAAGKVLRMGPCAELYASFASDPAQTCLDVAEELEGMGEGALAADLLKHLPEKTVMTETVRAFLSGDRSILQAAFSLPVGIAYPSRRIEYEALRFAAEGNQAEAFHLLGCLLYHLSRYEEAGECFRKALELSPENPLYLRENAVALYSHLGEREEALQLLQKARRLAPEDGQLQYETAHVMGRMGCAPREIVKMLEDAGPLREDTVLLYCRALSLDGRYEKALQVLSETDFTPCEGGEHAVAEQYMFAHHALGRKLRAEGKPEEALAHFRAAQHLPSSLGAGLWNEVLLVPHRFYEAVCLLELGRRQEADAILDWILLLKRDYFTDMQLPEFPAWRCMAQVLRNCAEDVPQVLKEYEAEKRQAALQVDAGYMKSTPFFLCYMEDAPTQRKASMDSLLAMACFAREDFAEAAAWAEKAWEADKTSLYTWLILERNGEPSWNVNNGCAGIS